MDATHRELKSSATGPRLGLALHLVSLSAARHVVNNLEWGTGSATKSDDILEKFQTAFDPPSFLENYIANFL